MYLFGKESTRNYAMKIKVDRKRKQESKRKRLVERVRRARKIVPFGSFVDVC